MFLKEYLPAISRFKWLLTSGTLAMLQAEIIFMKEPPGYFNHIHCGLILWMLLVNMTMDAARIPLLVLVTATTLIRGPPLCVTVFSAEKNVTSLEGLILIPNFFGYSSLSRFSTMIVKKLDFYYCSSYISHLPNRSNLIYTCE